MPLQAPAGLVYACITHVPLWVEYPDFVTPIYLGAAQADGRLNLRDLAPEWERFHPILGGTAGSFALKNFVLRQRPDATQVGLCQYRKFVSKQRLGGTPAPNYKVMDVLPKASLAAVSLAGAMLPGDAPFLLTRPSTFSRWLKPDDYLRQYARAHHVQDLLRFSAEAVAQGVLREDQVGAFFAEDVLIAGGIELGVFPAAFWLRSIGQVEAVVRACAERYPIVHDGYQARAWAFCVERLGSFLLLEHLRASVPGWQKSAIGQLNLIVEDGDETRYSIGS